MRPISYARHRFPPTVIRHAVWLYHRFTLSYRDVEELLAERGIEVSYESVPSLGAEVRTAIFTHEFNTSHFQSTLESAQSSSAK
jgi:transposase-like protein